VNALQLTNEQTLNYSDIIKFMF